VFVVTGGSSGVGLEVSRTLARRGARVVIASRDAARVDAAVRSLKAVLPPASALTGMVLDLASLRRVRS
jgi:NAD(P)-dependent dehydrogenase (short-subunit alcohol dehydrogenase family)